MEVKDEYAGNQAIAKERGVKSYNLKKAELVQASVLRSGKAADCGQREYLWKADCN